ncbi:hypothetical protein [Actinocrinis sp.]|uniref:hypothetical protein n=1 Tax=Actinocrinis sp. TaxID=1920516 RepID=UPI002CFACEC4|nr:hypothetical protein [Actinocrinis sp.]HXR71607.1 hypothetical protein [Actinocrinis sp.]
MAADCFGTALRVGGGATGAAGLVVLGVVCGAALVAAADEGEVAAEAAEAALVEEAADMEVSGLASAAGDAWVWTAQPVVTPARASITPDLTRTCRLRT